MLHRAADLFADGRAHGRSAALPVAVGLMLALMRASVLALASV